MKMFNKASVAIFFAMALIFGFVGLNSVQAATSPSLGTADSFSVLAGTAITNVPTSSIGGDVGLSPATGAGIGLTDAEVSGTIYSVDAFGPAGAVNNPGLLTTAKNDLSDAYDALVAGDNATCDVTYAGTQDLVGLNLVPGVYCADAFELSGTLTLSGSGVWIFRSASSLVTSGTANIVGGEPCNVWWRVVSSATLGTNTSLIGNILALTSITMATGADLNGRALARNGAVTLDNNTITTAACSVAAASADEDADIRVRKTASDYKLSSGPKKVTFTYKVTNQGDVALTDISVKDDECDDVDYVSGDDNDNDELDTDEEWKYTCKKTVRKTETNTVTAKGTANGERVKDTDKVKVVVSVPGLPSAGFAPADNNLWNSILAFFSF